MLYFVEYERILNSSNTLLKTNKILFKSTKIRFYPKWKCEYYKDNYSKLVNMQRYTSKYIFINNFNDLILYYYYFIYIIMYTNIYK